VLRLVESSDLATVLLRSRYRDRPPDGAPIDERSILSLVFRRGSHGWRMVLDQNTPCR
jgi:hypothetical protein